ncbi:anti-sigma factor family protein [Desulfitobacterium chlororespirans]|uniref:Anti-sigma-W factor RsiW n=1 Tax=Desulfitobacterium chlororespirans DSM 11544 TaxID=1121395 RepID=A0A1M7TXD4_9FIRM|nr:anti-sigma factor [Desulfitobacterium chlororespirans]SHN75404.1 Putative zinc-finger [Desulfitobacterium chlororespirans DSM 11544]
MSCSLEQSTIQAYLDGELSREERKEMALHLRSCPGCREELEKMKRLDEWLKTALTESLKLNTESEVSPDTQAAWEKLQARLAAAPGPNSLDNALETSALPNQNTELSPDLSKGLLKKGRWSTMKISPKRWIAGGVAAAVLASALFIPQVRVVASDMLGLLRIDKLQTVKLTPEDIEQIKANMSALHNGEIDLKGMGHMSVAGQPEPAVFTSTEAAHQAGVTVPELTGYTMLRAGKQEPFSANMQIDVAQFEAFAQQLGTSVALDPKLNKETIFISFGQSSFIEYSSESNPQARLHYAVSASPQLKVPEGIDVDQVRGALLMTPLLPENVRQQLANIQDWESTLPIPYVEGQDYSEDVKVQGNPGVFVAYAGGEHAVLIWQKDGLMHMLGSQGTEAQSNKELRNSLLAIASQI